LKLIVILLLAAVVASLAAALGSLFRTDRSEETSRRMLRALTLRVALSVTLFILLLLAWQLGLIQPHGLAG
jgi:hypothetical protein